MAKKTPSVAEPIFYAHTYRQSEEVRQNLRGLLGEATTEDDVHAQELALRRVAMWLGFYSEGVKNIDKAPTAADYIAKMEPLHERSLWLLSELSTTAYYREALKLAGADVYEIELALINLAIASHKVVQGNKATLNPKGRTKSKAMETTVLELRRAFQAAYRGSRTERAMNGQIRFVTNEKSFVKQALLSAGIIVDHYTGLSTLFGKPECDPETNQAP